MATNVSALTSAILPRVLGDILEEARPVSVLKQFANMYSLAGKNTNVLRLNRWGDIGAAAAGTEGTAPSVTDASLATAVDITPSEKVMLFEITDRALEQWGGYSGALTLFASNDLNAQLNVLAPFVRQMAAGYNEAEELDLAALFSSLTNVALNGAADLAAALQTDLTLARVEQAHFLMDTQENSHANRVLAIGPRGVSDLRRDLQVTSGGVQGVMWNNQQALQTSGMTVAGSLAPLWGAPVVMMSQTGVPTSGTVPGTGGHLGALLLVGSGNPEDIGGSGQVGALQYVSKQPVEIVTEFDAARRLIKVVASGKYGVALRSQNFGVLVPYDDA